MRRLSQAERIWFFRGLHLLYASGVNLERAMHALQQQADNPTAELLVGSLHGDLLVGHSLSASMRRSGTFEPLQVNLVKLGERLGKLEDVLQNLADHEERRAALDARLRSSLVYPLFLACACLVMVLAVPPFVMHGIVTFLASSHMPLPPLTRLVIALSDIMRTPLTWLGVVLLLVAVARGTESFLRSHERRILAEGLLRRLPVLGRLWSDLAEARFAGALESVVSSAGPLLTGLEMAAACSGSPLLNQEIRDVAERVRGGQPLARLMADSTCLSATFRHSFQVGVECGSLDRMVGSVCRLARQQVEDSVGRLCSLLEPMVMLMMGAVVGVLLVATMSPLLRLMEAL